MERAWHLLGVLLLLLWVFQESGLMSYSRGMLQTEIHMALDKRIPVSHRSDGLTHTPRLTTGNRHLKDSFPKWLQEATTANYIAIKGPLFPVFPINIY